MEKRREKYEAMTEAAPASARKILARAFSGSASPRGAIKAQCLACTGFDRSAVANCTGWTCPLWAYRPFQDEPKSLETITARLERLNGGGV